jgi:hypothetical protein
MFAAENEADAGAVVGLALEIVEGREIEIHLARVFRAEPPRLQVNSHEAA